MFYVIKTMCSLTHRVITTKQAHEGTPQIPTAFTESQNAVFQNQPAAPMSTACPSKVRDQEVIHREGFAENQVWMVKEPI